MSAIRTALCLLTVALFAGCATQPRPQLAEEQYTALSRAWVATHKCGAAGQMDPATAALGLRYVRATLHAHTFDEARIHSEVAALGSVAPTPADCNAASMQILARKQEIDIHNSWVDSNHQAQQDAINSTRSKQTYCNKVGTQTFCNTF
jgi:hypothetical protein